MNKQCVLIFHKQYLQTKYTASASSVRGHIFKMPLLFAGIHLGDLSSSSDEEDAEGMPFTFARPLSVQPPSRRFDQAGPSSAPDVYPGVNRGKEEKFIF